MAETIAELVAAQHGDHRTGLLFEDERWTHHQLAEGAAVRSALLRDLLPAGVLPHVGVLLDNVPEFPLWLGATALAGATLVGVNATRRGPELARDIAHTDCALLVTETAHLPLLDGVDLGIPVLVVDSPSYATLLTKYQDAAVPEVTTGDPATRHLILFTSGSTGAPKGVVCSQGRLARSGVALTEKFGFGRDSVNYICMPMFHGNALMANWSPALRAGGAVALRRRFSASGFLDDVRKFNADYFTYVGRAVSYLLATPERPDDADNPLRNGFGTEAGAVDQGRFEARFGCALTEGYGSSEGGSSVNRTADTPAAALGPCPPESAVLDPETGAECPRSVFDSAGRLVNGDVAIGELVNRGRNGFEGYWRNDAADAERRRDGLYWTGDHMHRDADGYLYFAARAADKLRVDGENLAVATIEGVLARHAPVEAVVVYAVPDPVTGDQVMAALQLRPGASFDPSAFAEFLAAQEDLGTKMAPRFVRVAGNIPTTATNKVDKTGLRRAGFRTVDPVWWQPSRGAAYRPFSAADRAALLTAYTEHGRLAALDF